MLRRSKNGSHKVLGYSVLPGWRVRPSEDPDFWRGSVRKIPSQSELDRVIRGTRKRILGIVKKYRDGDLTPGEFGDRMALLLEERHGRAAVLGRRRAGQFGPRNATDNLMGSIAVDGESEFLRDFVEALESSRYTDPETRMVNWRKITRRAVSYAEKLGGTANEAFGLASPLTSTFKWMLGLKEQHCDRPGLTCPDLAKDSAKTAMAMETWPRNCDTPCLNNCGCFVVRNDGRLGFLPTVSR